MSEQNLLNYNIFKSSTENSNELPFTYGYPLENAYSDQRKVHLKFSIFFAMQLNVFQ